MKKLLESIIQNDKIDKEDMLIICNNYAVFKKDNLYYCGLPGSSGIETGSVAEIIRMLEK